MSIYICSVPYDVGITLSKDKLVEKFPLFAGIIEQDPTVSRVDIENKSVTSEVLNYINHNK